MATVGGLARPLCEVPLQLTGGPGARLPKRQRRVRALLVEFQSCAAVAEQPPSSLTWQVAVGAIGERFQSLATVAEQPPSPLTWQVAVGTIAGLIPFLVAGFEFSKRISAQRKCRVCRGSGLVKRDEYYFRCYNCGGFLPWMSWRRFFSGK